MSSVDDVEIVGTPIGHEPTLAEEELAISEMTFYGSSKWLEMTRKWQQEHPQKKIELTPEQKAESERQLQEANLAWRKIQEEKKAVKEAAIKRLEEK